MADRATLTWSMTERAGETLIVLKGNFTESSDFESLIPLVPKVVAFDLDGIERINSTGIREWVNFVIAIERLGSKVALERCSVSVVTQLNMISNFAGGAEVRSIYAPYFCAHCHLSINRLIDMAGSPRERLADQVPCGQCKQPMEFDDLLERYLAFLA